MMYCVNCSMNLSDNEVKEEGFCPRCDSPIREIKTSRLVDILTELQTAVESLQSNVAKTSPKDIISVSRIIEKGEKKLKKELDKRLETLKDIDYEIEVINSFREFMGYTNESTRKDESHADSSAIELH